MGSFWGEACSLFLKCRRVKKTSVRRTSVSPEVEKISKRESTQKSVPPGGFLPIFYLSWLKDVAIENFTDAAPQQRDRKSCGI